VPIDDSILAGPANPAIAFHASGAMQEHLINSFSGFQKLECRPATVGRSNAGSAQT
jgi:hypothetical protein